MTDSQQQSYYELALTNRQVMVAFVVLLVCIFVAFFSGIWIGRNGDDDPIAQEPVQTAESAAADLDLGTLEFFSDNGKDAPKKPLEKAAREQRADTTLLQDVRGEEPDESAETPPAAARPKQAAPGPKSGKQPPETPAPEVPVATPAAPTGTEAASDLLQIQVFSSADGAQATAVKDRLLGAGFAAFISSVDVGGRTMHRVRIGPFKERSEASAVADRVRREFQLDTWITY